MFRKILVAVDGSPHARAALSAAIDMAKRYHAQLGLVYAFPHVSDLLGTPQYDELLQSRIHQGEVLLEEMRAQVAAEIPTETHLIEGPPAAAILHISADEHYDLIVIGSRGRSRLAGLLLGSVSSTVAQHSECPVMIIHSNQGVPIAV